MKISGLSPIREVVFMIINQIIKYFIAFGALVGGIDRLIGNRFGLGERFENGFRLLGSLGLSMAGIICMAPVLSSVLGIAVAPLSRLTGIDPGIFGSILSIDMGGYQLALDLARDPELGRFFAVIVTSSFGCTVVFSIPVGLGALDADDHPLFIKGILLGFMAMPFSILAAGLVFGLSVTQILWNCLPILLLSLLLCVGIFLKPKAMSKGFQIVARVIRIIGTVGLIAAAIRHICGIEILKGMPPLLEAMETICSIGITLLGSMPLAELFQRVMKKPLAWIRQKTGLSPASTTALLLSSVTVTPTIAMKLEIDKRGKVVVSAFIVCCCSLFGSNIDFTMAAQPDMVTALLCSKLVGGFLAAVFALFATRAAKLA